MASTFTAAGTSLGFGRTGVGTVDAPNNGGLGGALQSEVDDESEDLKLKRKLGLLPQQNSSVFSGLMGGSAAGKALMGSLGGMLR
jgi:hypothetical protein